MAKKPAPLKFNEASLTTARHMLQSLRSKLKGLDELDKLIGLLENKSQVISERKRTLDSINAEIAKRENTTLDGAKAEAKAQTDKLIAEAKAQTEAILADCAAQRDAINAEVEARKADLAALNAKIEKAKAEVRRVLSAA